MTTTFSTNGNGHLLPTWQAMPEQPDGELHEERDSPAALRRRGLIRVHGQIPIVLNERLKAMARAQGRNADELIGDLIQQCTADVDRWEAEQEVQRLRDRFGDAWLEVLKNADTSTPTDEQ